MPELPEVETVMRGLTPAMAGRRIQKLHQNRPDLRFPFPKDLVAATEGQRISGLRRIAKYLLFDLEDGTRILSHLGMSGRMTIGQQDDPGLGQGRHDHIVFDLDDGGRVVFSDPRRFGMADLIRPGMDDHDHKLLAHLGPDPLGNGFHEDYLRAALKGRKTPMKSALLDQKIVAGLGNIYVCEALFRAGISPKRSAASMGPGRCAKLVPVIRDVLTEAIASGGSSLKDYRQADGELGYFQHGFKVYDREGTPCPTPGCGKPIKRLVQSGRSTFYCSACQR